MFKGFCAGMEVFVQTPDFVQSHPLPPPIPRIIGLARKSPQNPHAKGLKYQNLRNKGLRGATNWFARPSCPRPSLQGLNWGTRSDVTRRLGKSLGAPVCP